MTNKRVDAVTVAKRVLAFVAGQHPIDKAHVARAARRLRIAFAAVEAEARADERVRCKLLAREAVPTNWCDVLLTGPDTPSGSFTPKDVERLLLGVQDRIGVAIDAPGGKP